LSYGAALEHSKGKNYYDKAQRNNASSIWQRFSGPVILFLLSMRNENKIQYYRMLNKPATVLWLLKTLLPADIQQIHAFTDILVAGKVKNFCFFMNPQMLSLEEHLTLMKS
jgi:hypothetical protein